MPKDTQPQTLAELLAAHPELPVYFMVEEGLQEWNWAFHTDYSSELAKVAVSGEKVYTDPEDLEYDAEEGRLAPGDTLESIPWEECILVWLS